MIKRFYKRIELIRYLKIAEQLLGLGNGRWRWPREQSTGMKEIRFQGCKDPEAASRSWNADQRRVEERSPRYPLEFRLPSWRLYSLACTASPTSLESLDRGPSWALWGWLVPWKGCGRRWKRRQWRRQIRRLWADRFLQFLRLWRGKWHLKHCMIIKFSSENYEWPLTT